MAVILHARVCCTIYRRSRHITVISFHERLLNEQGVSRSVQIFFHFAFSAFLRISPASLIGGSVEPKARRFHSAKPNMQKQTRGTSDLHDFLSRKLPRSL